MDILYDEQRGNPPEPEVKVSIAVAEPLYRATAKGLAWGMPADGDANYRTIAIVRLETVLKVCQVEWPLARPIGGMLVRVLHLFDFIEPALAELIAKGWLQDDDGNEVVFDRPEEMYERAWDLI